MSYIFFSSYIKWLFYVETVVEFIHLLYISTQSPSLSLPSFLYVYLPKLICISIWSSILYVCLFLSISFSSPLSLFLFRSLMLPSRSGSLGLLLSFSLSLAHSLSLSGCLSLCISLSPSLSLSLSLWLSLSLSLFILTFSFFLSLCHLQCHRWSTYGWRVWRPINRRFPSR